MLIRLLKGLGFPLFFGIILFVSAGRLDVPAFWAYVLVVGLVFAPAAMLFPDPELAKERMRPGPGGVDAGLRKLAAPLALIHLVIAGLDVGRYGWSAPPPVALQAGALVAVAAGYALIVWSMVSNTFFSPVVRIQAERGHAVVTTGPYQVVRHPGYLGMVAAYSLSGVALGSWWALLPMLVLVALVCRRTVIEDRFLLEKLGGYADYARDVRWKLVPGIW